MQGMGGSGRAALPIPSRLGERRRHVFAQPVNPSAVNCCDIALSQTHRPPHEQSNIRPMRIFSDPSYRMNSHRASQSLSSRRIIDA